MDWHNLYGESWANEITPEAFSHPAKFSRALIRHIYQHAIEEGWLSEGATVIDPFGGVALGALDAMRRGMNWCGVELEHRFVSLGQQNIDLWNDRYSAHFPGWGTARILQGDSRYLTATIGEAAGCVSSPPYADIRQDGGKIAKEGQGGMRPYSDDPVDAWFTQRDQRNLGNLRSTDEGYKAAISSPPYADGCAHTGGDDTNPEHIEGGEYHGVGIDGSKAIPAYGRADILSRFMSHVDLTDYCWEWTGKKRKDGYGKFWLDGKEVYAHRASWEIYHGEIPDNMLVCHHCDNPSCVNPEHLFIGDEGDNWRDCIAKGRSWMQTQPEKLPRGEDNGSSKLTNEQVLEIYEKYKTGKYTLEGLGAEYGVSRHPIFMIVHGKHWTHVTGAMKAADFEGCVSSPPYAETLTGDSKPHGLIGKVDEVRKNPRHPGEKLYLGRTSDDYGSTPGNLGNMRAGDLDEALDD